MIKSSLIFSVLLIMVIPAQLVFAQDSLAASQDILETCKALGIDPGKCSEVEIVKTRERQMVNTPSEEVPLMGWPTIVIFAAILGAGGSFLILKLRKGKRVSSI